MKAEPKFLNQPKTFWAHVRTISENLGYTAKDGRIKVPTLAEMRRAFARLSLDPDTLANDDQNPKPLAQTLILYFHHRARVLNRYVEPRLMDKERARKEYQRLKAQLRPTCPLPMNKQKGEKKGPAYLTGIVNMLVAHHSRGATCDFDPRTLTTFTLAGAPVRTLARRVDGAFPGAVNPVAIWEIKEYYNTTTFGSRVADGVYESLLDGLELEELRSSEGIDVRHYLIVDDRFTWWSCGRSYLCRIIDMLHMGYLDEALFGFEVLEKLPAAVRSWLKVLKNRGSR